MRPTYVKKGDPEAVPTTAPLPVPLLEGSVLTASLGAHLLTEKFCYHQPFWRQEWKLRATHGIELTRNLMCHWHNHLADQLLPIYNLIGASLRASDYLKVDETPIKYLDPGTGKTSTGQFWVYHHADHGPLYDWHTSRANTCLERILLGSAGDAPFAGYLQSDGLRAYTTFIARQPENTITPVSCLAHIRRKFVEAKGDHPKITAWILYQIGQDLRARERVAREPRRPRGAKTGAGRIDPPPLRTPQKTRRPPRKSSQTSPPPAGWARRWATPAPSCRTSSRASRTARSSSTTTTPRTR